MTLPDFIKAVILDIDGTLLDSLSVWSEADREFLLRRGISYDPEVSRRLKALHFVSASQFLIDLYSLSDSLENVCAEITDIVRQKYFFEIPLMPYAAEFIKYCSKKGIKLCAATSNSRELSEGALLHNGILESLLFVMTSDEVGSDKSSPDIFLKCAQRMEAAISETAVFEDSPHAAASAHSAGFFVIGMNNGDPDDFSGLESCTDMRADSFSAFCECNTIYNDNRKFKS